MEDARNVSAMVLLLRALEWIESYENALVGETSRLRSKHPYSLMKSQTLRHFLDSEKGARHLEQVVELIQRGV